MSTLSPSMLPLTNDLTRAARDLGFLRWHEVQERVSIADVYRRPDRCGIYVLSFSNGQAYAGKSVDVTRRYAQHRKLHVDIETISFKPVKQQSLPEEEKAVIERLESAGIDLRNIIFTSFIHGPSDFDLIMRGEDQARWLADLDYIDLVGPRTNDAETRRRFGRRYQEFLERPRAEEAVRVLRAYAHGGIPALPSSEMSFWACTCLPGYPNYPIETYARVNIYQQEVFAVFIDEGQLCFSWHLAKSPLESAFGPSLSQIERKFRAVEVVDHVYVPGGQDQIQLWARGADAALSLLRDPAVLRSIRLFNFRLMQKGPCMFSRYHCFDLADRFYDQTKTDSLLVRARSLFGRH